MAGRMRDRRCAWQGACVAGGHAWQRWCVTGNLHGMHAPTVDRQAPVKTHPSQTLFAGGSDTNRTT